MNIKKYVETKETKNFTLEVKYTLQNECPAWILYLYPNGGWICNIGDFGTKKEAMQQMRWWARSDNDLKKLYLHELEKRDQILLDTFGKKVTESIHLAESL